MLLFLYNFSALYKTLSVGVPFGPAFFTFDESRLATDMAVAVIGLSLNEAAYAAEVVRGGILSVDQGQHEAASALGLPKGYQFRRIVFPQALRSITPNYVNQLIGLIKSTSLVFYVSLLDLFGSAQSMGATYPGDIVPLLLVATVWYLILTSVVSVIQFYVERHYARGATAHPAADPVAEAAGRPARSAGPHPQGGRRMTHRDRPEPPTDRHTSRAAVEVHDVHKWYGAHRVLDGVDLTVRPGEVTVILGPSGSGKSTLLRVINHLEKPETGHVSVNGELDRRPAHGERLKELSERAILTPAQPHRLRLPELQPLPAPDRAGQRGRRPGGDRQADASPRPRIWPANCSAGSAWPTRPAPTRGSCPAASSSAWPSPAPWPCGPESSSSTSRPPRSTPNSSARCSPSSRTWPRSGTTLVIVTHEIGFAREVADRSSSSTAAGSSNRGRPPRCSTTRHERTRDFLSKVL